MKKKLQSTVNRLIPLTAVAVLLFFWQIMYMAGVLPAYMLPSPLQVVAALVGDFSLLLHHMETTLLEAFAGLAIGIVSGFLVAALMEHSSGLNRALYPLLVITQTVPTVAIAPLLVLWMGYGAAPKITLVVIVTFFPIAVGLLDGFKTADRDAVRLLQAMGASPFQIFWHIKLPGSLNHFFAGVRISVSYAIVGAVISEWLGGFQGLGVYMTRVKKSYSYDKMFGVIFLITAMSLALMKLVDLIQWSVMPWNRKE
ncbi:MAG: ABC transporter permease [Lachnospiraceae bacterium]|nr:ABC transporter permease [Lachnospiraceae bacterium]